MINIAILGFGTVGKGVYKVINDNGESISRALGGNKTDSIINVKYILDLLDFPEHPAADRVVHDYAKILEDKSVTVVAETMGGSHPAFEFSKAALEAGKSVVTSNKEVVDKFGAELLDIAAKNNVSYLFEASVGGGIPIIQPLTNCFAANKITKISGILNGTTNFILHKMQTEGMSLDQALAIAQQKGYAEANPENDLAGYDSARKISILAGIAFNYYIPYENLPVVQGIRNVTQEDFRYAADKGFTIKLLADARLQDGRARIVVAPFLVEKDTVLASTVGVFNAISVTGSSVGEVIFYGRGAGELPTASAVVSDIVEIIKCVPEAKPRRTLPNGFIISSQELEEEKITFPNNKTYRVYTI